MKTILVFLILLISSQVYSQRIVKNYCYEWEKWDMGQTEKGKTETVFTWNFDKNTVKQKSDGKSYETLTFNSASYIKGAFMIFDVENNSLGITKIGINAETQKHKSFIAVYYGNNGDDPFIIYTVSKTTN